MFPQTGHDDHDVLVGLTCPHGHRFDYEKAPRGGGLLRVPPRHRGPAGAEGEVSGHDDPTP